MIHPHPLHRSHHSRALNPFRHRADRALPAVELEVTANPPNPLSAVSFLPLPTLRVPSLSSHRPHCVRSALRRRRLPARLPHLPGLRQHEVYTQVHLVLLVLHELFVLLALLDCPLIRPTPVSKNGAMCRYVHDVDPGPQLSASWTLSLDPNPSAPPSAQGPEVPQIRGGCQAADGARSAGGTQVLGFKAPHPPLWEV